MGKTSGTSTNDSTSTSTDGSEAPSNTVDAPTTPAVSEPAPSGQEATDRENATLNTTGDQTGDRKVDQGPVDPTDGSLDEAGGSTVIAEGGENRDWSNPDQNANVGYNAEGVVVSNQQGEQVNTVQAREEERAEAQDLIANEGTGQPTAETDSGATVTAPTE